MNVYLCGLIGSGKTVIGERLAARLRRPFFDLDREMDREIGRSFHLEADLAVLAERVRRADRPRVNPGESPEKDLQRIWSAAGPLYRQAADLVYRTDTGKQVEVEVDDLLGLLAARGVG